MKRLFHAGMTASPVLSAALLLGALIAGISALAGEMDSSDPQLNLSTRIRPPVSERGEQYEMSLATISSGAASFADGSLAIVGEPMIGTTVNDQYMMEVGAAALLLASTIARPGDANGDGDVNLEDYAFLSDCMAGPDTAPTPTGAITPEECLDAFNLDADNDVDLFDAVGFGLAFEGG